MTTPVRLRLSRLRGFDLQTHSRAVNGLAAVNVARPTKWGNPFKCGPWVSPEQAVDALRSLFDSPEDRGRWPFPDAATVSLELRRKNLACWCALDAPCHADVLLEIANRPICEAVDG